MLAIISPSKLMDYKTSPTTDQYTIPEQMDKAEELISKLKKLSVEEVADLMNINDKLARENFDRFQLWKPDFSLDNAKQSILAYKGEVFNGLDAYSLSENELLYAQDHLRILSGLFGVLKPLDLIMPYRLEMKTELKIGKHNNLYDYWGNLIYHELEKAIQESGSDTLINLASKEYSKAARLKKLKARVIDINFKQIKGDQLKQIIIYTKKARGMMVRFMHENQIEDPDHLKAFDYDGYLFDEELSDKDRFTFVKNVL